MEIDRRVKFNEIEVFENGVLITDDYLKKFINQADANSRRHIIKKNRPQIWKYLCLNYNVTDNISKEAFAEIIYCIKHNIDEKPICPICGKLAKSKGKDGYCTFCSNECKNTPEGKAYILKKSRATCFKHFGVETSSQSPEVQKKIIESNLKKFGTERPAQNPDIVEKAKKTCIDKFGVDNPMKCADIQEKQRETCIEKFGVDNVSKSDEIKEKKRQTNLQKRGVDCPFQDDEVKKKIEETNIEKYGNSCSLLNDEVKQKSRETCREKFGCDYPMQNSDIREKMVSTVLDKFGVDNVSKSPEIIDRIKQVHIDEYGSLDAYYQHVKDKGGLTRRKSNGKLGMSVPEQIAYKFFADIFGLEDIVYDLFIDERYPYSVDFYIKSVDVFVEINGYWGHGTHPFDKNNQNDIEILENWKSRNLKGYNYAVHVWSVSDVEKLETAIRNNLKYVVIYCNKRSEYTNIEQMLIDKFAELDIDIPDKQFNYSDDELYKIS